MPLALAAFLVVAGCGRAPSEKPSTETTSTSTATTAAPSNTAVASACPSFGGLAETSGAGAVTRTPPIALLANVQVQASSCVDEIAFSFFGGTPDWSASYRDGPLTQDPSDLPMDVAGAAHLVVRLAPAAGADLAADEPITTYDGPGELRPAAPSGVVEVERMGDFEAVTSWVVGLPEARPFEVVVRPEQIVVRIAAPSAREPRCTAAGEGPALTVGFPADWFVELSDRWSCRYLDPAPFVVHPSTNDLPWAVTVQRADAGADEVLRRMAGSPGVGVQRSAATVAGLPATVLDVTESGEGMLPAGFGFRLYVVDTGDAALLVQGAAAPPGPQIAANRDIVDRIARLVRPG